MIAQSLLLMDTLAVRRCVVARIDGIHTMVESQHSHHIGSVYAGPGPDRSAVPFLSLFPNSGVGLSRVPVLL